MNISTVKENITETPAFTVFVEKVSTMKTSEGDVVRVVFRRSDDGRRTTCFYPANAFAAESLHAMLAQLIALSPPINDQ